LQGFLHPQSTPQQKRSKLQQLWLGKDLPGRKARAVLLG
jgi:hypothetical protein